MSKTLSAFVESVRYYGKLRPSAAYARVKLTDSEGEEISCPLQATDGKLVVSASVSAGCQAGDVYTLAVKVEDSAGTLVTLSHEYTVTEA